MSTFGPAPAAVDSAAPGAHWDLLEHLTTAVLRLDCELRVVYLNPAAEALLEVSANQVRGMTIPRLLPGAEVLCATLARAARGAEPLAERDMVLRGVGAQSVAVHCVVTPIAETSPELSLLVELLPLRRHKQISREEQQLALSDSARALARGLAHEIRNPLGGLRGAAQLLERELDDPALTEYTQVIIGEADRLQDLVERMLGPRSALQARKLNIHEITDRVHALLRAERDDRIVIQRDYDPSLPALYADPDLLIQAILNVTRNAVQAVGEGGRVGLRTRIDRQVTIGQRRHRLAVRVEVSDDGAGVAEALRERIFLPLVSGRPGGTGLGLSIAQAVVRQHGGLIECDSAPGDTTFSILLPVHDENPGASLE